MNTLIAFREDNQDDICGLLPPLDDMIFHRYMSSEAETWLKDTLGTCGHWPYMRTLIHLCSTSTMQYVYLQWCACVMQPNDWTSSCRSCSRKCRKRDQERKAEEKKTAKLQRKRSRLTERFSPVSEEELRLARESESGWVCRVQMKVRDWRESVRLDGMSLNQISNSVSGGQDDQLEREDSDN